MLFIGGYNLCDFCDRKILHFDKTSCIEVRKEEGSNSLRIMDYEGNTFYLEINYCPMCGAKLQED